MSTSRNGWLIVSLGLSTFQVILFSPHPICSGQFKQIFSFTAERFQPAWASPFIANFAVSHYIEDSKFPESIPILLESAQRLGPTSNVIMIAQDPLCTTKLISQRYYWVHKFRAPYGQALPTACPECLCFRKMKIATNVSSGGSVKVIVTCSQVFAPVSPGAESATCKYRWEFTAKPGRERGTAHRVGQWFGEDYDVRS